ncbi:uncharacterized protein [Asterias amurensis]|uniref:uncharacterized protein n=1 Tax=Asterias amurensis TaxID=7602 RepID=UPI003AB38C96
MDTVNFCRPLALGETVCHNVTCNVSFMSPLPELPPLFSCSNYTDLPSCVRATTVPPTDNLTTMSSSATSGPGSDGSTCDETCIAVILCLSVLLVVLIALAVLLHMYCNKTGLFKNRKAPSKYESSREFDRSNSAEQILSQEQHNNQRIEMLESHQHSSNKDNNDLHDATIVVGMKDPEPGTTPEMSVYL